jgi:polyphosphate kinase 2 (PPK2 family)
MARRRRRQEAGKERVRGTARTAGVAVNTLHAGYSTPAKSPAGGDRRAPTTAGKGGVINALSQTLNPRQCRVVALSKPTERERSQWYFQRYVEHLPAAGEIVLLDRSWYNRAGVERVMGYCTKPKPRPSSTGAPVFEQMLGGRWHPAVQVLAHGRQAQQEARFAERLEDPLKRWKTFAGGPAGAQPVRRLHPGAPQVLDATHTKSRRGRWWTSTTSGAGG